MRFASGLHDALCVGAGQRLPQLLDVGGIFVAVQLGNVDDVLVQQRGYLMHQCIHEDADGDDALGKLRFQ